MKINYYQDADSLYIDLSAKKSSQSKEISPGVVLDCDRWGVLVGMDIDNASQKLDLKNLIIHDLPSEVHIKSN